MADRREYFRNRRKQRRLAAIKYLGGACVDCEESNPANLEFDHVYGKKVFNISSRIWSKWEVLVTELDKCQLRCLDCHALKDGRLFRDRWGDMKREGKNSVNVRYKDDDKVPF